MSGCVDGGASTTDGAMVPAAMVGPMQSPVTAVACRSERTYASTSSRWAALSGARIIRRAAALVALRNCSITGTNDGSRLELAPAPHDCGITGSVELDEVSPTVGRSG